MFTKIVVLATITLATFSPHPEKNPVAKLPKGTVTTYDGIFCSSPTHAENILVAFRDYGLEGLTAHMAVLQAEANRHRVFVCKFAVEHDVLLLETVSTVHNAPLRFLQEQDFGYVLMLKTGGRYYCSPSLLNLERIKHRLFGTN